MAIYFIVALIAYLLGSIPFGYILVRVFRGEDVRAIGSGNIGATNVARKAPGLGIATLVLDALKGFTAVAIATALAHSHLNNYHPDVMTSIDAYNVAPGLLAGIAALSAILGHMFPVWLKFKGGKGVATGVGSFLALAPKAVLIVLLIFVAVVAVFRYVSLGSIVATGLFPLFVWLTYRAPWWVTVWTVASAALIIVRHHENIRRLLAGTEHRFELKHR
jgi:acyl phosphate:glycerol-3-phosphate acyltransferase